MTPESCAIMLKYVGISAAVVIAWLVIWAAIIRWNEVKSERANPYA